MRGSEASTVIVVAAITATVIVKIIITVIIIVVVVVIFIVMIMLFILLAYHFVRVQRLLLGLWSTTSSTTLRPATPRGCEIGS